jgi:hypothetical protein
MDHRKVENDTCVIIIVMPCMVIVWLGRKSGSLTKYDVGGVARPGQTLKALNKRGPYLETLKPP